MIPDILYEEPGKGKGKELLSPFDELHLPDELPLPDEPPPSYESLASNASPPFDGQPPAYRGLSDELREKFSKAGITDNDLEILTSYETVFIVDDSSSMAWDRKVLWYEVSDTFSLSRSNRLLIIIAFYHRYVLNCRNSRPSRPDTARAGLASTSSIASSSIIVRTSKCDFIFSTLMTMY